MASTAQVITKLNAIRAREERMALVYRRAAQLVTGPSRESIVEEFLEHAGEEDKHAEIAMRHLIALGGDLDADVAEIPVLRDLNGCLNYIEELEVAGLKLWQELLNTLPSTDAFRHTIESVLDREQTHLDEVRRWRRTDSLEKSMGDLGSPKPLNWNTPLWVGQDAPVAKSSHAAKADTHSRAGTPPTIRGAFHGRPSALKPASAPESNPPLLLKAVIDPAEAGAGKGDSAATHRKRDASGKFSSSESEGEASTGQDDAAAAARRQRLSQARLFGDTKKGLGMPNLSQGELAAGPAALQPPGQSPDSGLNMQDPMQGMMPIGYTPSGKPIFDDAYHPSHSNFDMDDHMAAAQMHQQMAQREVDSGNVPGAMNYHLQGQIHGELANDAKSPMHRAYEGAGPDGMQDFMSMLGGEASPDAQMQPDPMQPPQTGPLPGMMNTNTGAPTGILSQQGNAGTVPRPAPIPAGPEGSSMPDIQGAGMPQDDLFSFFEGGQQGAPGMAPPQPPGALPPDFYNQGAPQQSPGGQPGMPPPSAPDAMGQAGGEEDFSTDPFDFEADDFLDDEGGEGGFGEEEGGIPEEEGSFFGSDEGGGEESGKEEGGGNPFGGDSEGGESKEAKDEGDGEEKEEKKDDEEEKSTEENWQKSLARLDAVLKGKYMEKLYTGGKPAPAVPGAVANTRQHLGASHYTSPSAPGGTLANAKHDSRFSVAAPAGHKTPPRHMGGSGPRKFDADKSVNAEENEKIELDKSVEGLFKL